jgi:hypothetical protein
MEVQSRDRAEGSIPEPVFLQRKHHAKTKRTGPESRADALGEVTFCFYWRPVF